MTVPDHSGAMLWAQVPYSMFWEVLSGCKSIVDAGCGTGGNSIDMALDGKEVIGIDTSIPALILAKSKAEMLGNSRKEFVENVVSFGLENNTHFIGYHFLSDYEKTYMSLSPGDVAEHDCYTQKLPLRANLEDQLDFLCADIFSEKAVKSRFDAVVCINTIHMFERFKIEWLENLIDYVSDKGILFLAYASCSNEYPDFIGMQNKEINCGHPYGCRMSEIMNDLGFEFMADKTKKIQQQMNNHLQSFLYPGVPIWQRQYQQSLYIGRKR